MQSISDVQKAASIYSKSTLLIYDFLVLKFSNTFAWKCPSKNILKLYNQYISNNHLDIGIGTGYFLDKCNFTDSNPNIHLLDLNPNCLEVAANRIKRYQPKTHLANILEPLTIDTSKFDSIGLNYLFHCLPGNMASKEMVLKNVVPLLNPNGKIFGSTILGKNIRTNFLAKKLMKFYNVQSIFNNTQDDLISLDKMLAKHLTHYSIHTIGCVAIFWGSVQ